MSLDTIIDSNQNAVIHIVTGPLMLDEIKQATVRLFSDPHFRPDMDILVDLRNGTVRNLSQQDIELFVALNRQMAQERGVGRTAIVTNRDIDFGIARQIQAMLEGSPREINIFREYDKALEWLAAGC